MIIYKVTDAQLGLSDGQCLHWYQARKTIAYNPPAVGTLTCAPVHTLHALLWELEPVPQSTRGTPTLGTVTCTPVYTGYSHCGNRDLRPSPHAAPPCCGNRDLCPSSHTAPPAVGTVTCAPVYTPHPHYGKGQQPLRVAPWQCSLFILVLGGERGERSGWTVWGAG